MDISKVRSNFHKATQTHKRRNKYMTEPYNDSIDAYEDLRDKLQEATVLLRKTIEYMPREGFEIYTEIIKFLEEL